MYQSGFLHEFFPAFGAGDGDLALALGHPHRLAALGADEVAMLLVLDPVDEHQKSLVFPVALVNIPGKTPENGDAHQDIGSQLKNDVNDLDLNEHAQQRKNQAHHQDQHIQFVGAVTALHKAAKFLLHAIKPFPLVRLL